MAATGVAGHDAFMNIPPFATKQHGHTPNSRLHNGNKDHHLISNHKRSYRRAVKRAQRDGFTWYRGKLYDACALGTTVRALPSTGTIPLPHSVTPSCRELRNRVHLFSWNCGGLGRSKLEEILAWARPQKIQILALQEIRWDGIKEWNHEAWYLIAAGGNPRQSTGVLVAVRKTFCNIDQLSWKSVLDGRLLHVRIHHQRPLDILNFYQKTYQHMPHVLQTREDVFRTLDECLAMLPTRNNLLLVGDFNTSLPHQPPHVAHANFVGDDGHSTVGFQHPDQHLLSAILKQHGLCAVNTMLPGLPATFMAAKVLDLASTSFVRD